MLLLLMLMLMVMVMVVVRCGGGVAVAQAPLPLLPVLQLNHICVVSEVVRAARAPPTAERRRREGVARVASAADRCPASPAAAATHRVVAPARVVRHAGSPAVEYDATIFELLH